MSAPSPAPHPVTRTLAVTGLAQAEQAAALAAGLATLEGMEHATADPEQGEVTVTYDLRRLQLPTVVALLEDLGHPPAAGFLAQQRLQWLLFTEGNERDNLTHQAPCCSKPPPGA